ncbi:hypothetical protein J6590_016984 [Homalodisca vitripennis]|nr:hypothetical protein J6590_016984 [Homalodisca vitripennis]
MGIRLNTFRQMKSWESSVNFAFQDSKSLWAFHLLCLDNRTQMTRYVLSGQEPVGERFAQPRQTAPPAHCSILTDRATPTTALLGDKHSARVKAMLTEAVDVYNAVKPMHLEHNQPVLQSEIILVPIRYHSKPLIHNPFVGKEKNTNRIFTTADEMELNKEIFGEKH